MRNLLFVAFVLLERYFQSALCAPYAPVLPEENMTVPEIIQYYGYKCEPHQVVTQDGYILTLHRIPSGQEAGKKVAYLQHGFLDSASTWVMNPPSQSLAFMLADMGYDVWLGNSRGNIYSTGHVNLSIHDAKYWDFSFDEMAKYDLPACIDYILNITDTPDLYYVGHSQGTAIGFIAFGENKELASKIKTFFALAPVATVSHVEGPLSKLAGAYSVIEEILKVFNINDLLPSNKYLDFFAEKLCGLSGQTESVCENLAFLIAGPDQTNFNKTRVPVYLSHFPSGTSVHDFLHYLQMINSGKFLMFDYGEAQNMMKYNQTSPPLYNVSKCSVPVVLFTGGEDWLADPTDVAETILPNLPNILNRINYDTYNHLDFVWGVDANKKIYDFVIKYIQQNN